MPLRVLRPGKVLVLGAGGGFDVTLALQAGARHVDAVEINGEMLRLTRSLGDFSGHVYDRDDVSVFTSDARRFVAASAGGYDAIVLSLMQTDPAVTRAPTSAESWTMTVEAVSAYLSRLAPGGFVAIVQSTPGLADRTVAIASAALSRLGLSRAECLERLLLFGLPATQPSPFAQVVLIRRAPWPADARGALEAAAEAAGAISRSVAAAAAVAGPVATDDRPFFFETGPELRLLLGTVAAGAVALLLALFAREGLAGGAGRLPPGAFVCASGLGAGFLLVESALIAHAHFALGRPAAAVALAVGALLAAAGGACAAVSGPARPRLTWGAALVAIMGALEALAWPWLARAVTTPGAAVASIVALAACLSPLGLCLPSLIELAGGGPRTATILAANAAGAVLGGALASLLARGGGFGAVLVGGSVCYGVAAILGARASVSRADAVAAGLRHHVPADPQEARDHARILAFIDAHAEPFDRRIPEGHLTASALVLTRDGRLVLLLHHPKLGKWLQPGGHAEPGEGVGEAVALREAREETGLCELALHDAAPRPLDVDVHQIPARGAEPAHEHLDLRYLVVVPDAAEPRPSAGESQAIRFFAWEELDGLGLDPGLRRALAKARRWLAAG
jgi:8-oxo-dGTP pyrophosphatase MutT (NUDIX family)/SAM-dependent methyltransferase